MEKELISFVKLEFLPYNLKYSKNKLVDKFSFSKLYQLLYNQTLVKFLRRKKLVSVVWRFQWSDDQNLSTILWLSMLSVLLNNPWNNSQLYISNEKKFDDWWLLFFYFCFKRRQSFWTNKQKKINGCFVNLIQT